MTRRGVAWCLEGPPILVCADLQAQYLDEEFVTAAVDFIERNTREEVPWFCYLNTTRMHVFTHLKPESQGKTGLGVYPDGMVELDGYVGPEPRWA